MLKLYLFRQNVRKEKPFDDVWESTTTLFGILIGSVDVIRIREKIRHLRVRKDVSSFFYENIIKEVWTN